MQNDERRAALGQDARSQRDMHDVPGEGGTRAMEGAELMRRNPTRAEKKAWAKAYGRRLVGFMPCVGGNPKGVTHWSAIERHWNGGTVYVRLCDLIGSWDPEPHRTVDCMTCLTRMDNLFIEEPT
jgi:hypothetical protein